MAGVKDIAELAASDGRVKDIFDEFGSSLAYFLSPYLLRFGAGVLVLGGNISRAYALFGAAFERGLIKNNCDTLPLLSELREDAALLGSAYLLDDSFWARVKESLQYM
jgi:glucokinase